MRKILFSFLMASLLHGYSWTSSDGEMGRFKSCFSQTSSDDSSCEMEIESGCACVHYGPMLEEWCVPCSIAYVSGSWPIVDEQESLMAARILEQKDWMLRQSSFAEDDFSEDDGVLPSRDSGELVERFVEAVRKFDELGAREN